jgi:hypothetical protein
MSTKYNYNEPNNFGSLYENVYSTFYKMNTFTPSGGYDLEYIVLEGKRVNNCVSVDVDIFAADGAHKPTGSSLATVQILQALLPTSEAEITFTLSSPLALSSGQEYVVVVSSAGPNSSNMFQWAYGFSNTSGYRGASSDSGSTWTGVINTQGMWFQAWGAATGNSQVDTPSPADEATGQPSGGVDLSWADPNDPDFDDYEVYFGPTGSMVLVETGYGELSLTISDTLTLGQEYSWRIDGNDGVDVVTGSVWTFTVESLMPPSTNLSTIKRLVAISNNEVWYEDI